MSRAVVTAKMLDDLLRSGTPIVLAKGSLVTPAAKDWLKEHKVPVTWQDTPTCSGRSLAVVLDPKVPELRAMRIMLDRAGGLVDVIEPAPGMATIAAAARRLCGKIRRGEVAKGVVFAADGAVPVCLANKIPGIRAALGACVPTVEEAIRELGINLLVIEYPRQSPYLMRQMVERFAAGRTMARPEVAAMISEIEQGGGRADW
ncbi:MAG TPA: RpiB/LacA/LacB family sugar-phosphate isomerase [Phycisphaerae bacterium]|nr:RpiB/LacA/LacB family sugar-phosphate isomerase [Phycisphaerae bacterium]